MRTEAQKLAASNLAKIADLYAKGDAIVAKLGAQSVITAAQVADKDRRVQCFIASDHWAKCDKGARTVLLNSHPHVVSCAQISAMDEKTSQN